MCGAYGAASKMAGGFSPMHALLDRNKKGTPASRGAANAAAAAAPVAALTPGAAPMQPRVRF